VGQPLTCHEPANGQHVALYVPDHGWDVLTRDDAEAARRGEPAWRWFWVTRGAGDALPCAWEQLAGMGLIADVSGFEDRSVEGAAWRYPHH
jgi:hypothetical protein